MNRRKLLAVMGASAIAGCSNDSSAAESETASDPNGDRSGEDEAVVETTVGDTELTARETAGDDVEAAVTGTVENTGDVRLGAVTAAAKFFNADGELLSSPMWDIRDFEPGEVWEPWIPYSDDPGRVDRAELVVTDEIAYGWTISPEGLILASNEIQIPVDDYAMPRVVGEVVNEAGTSVQSIQARPKVYAENGILLETAIKSTQQVDAGESWQFDIQVHFNNESWKDRIDDYDIVLTR